ncbi:hypothetical protein O6H91_09G103500 [Diphasiastrum complanatum]|uniref:Uncharacterized protein n=1 Tax=Diphasiastrum complanatum TaxID=34168 RepID=A0ACC2CSJ0_DIPCM|nr:hypothetical protein O6H91_09G103500 [Diphasiastrum complanatum]
MAFYSLDDFVGNGVLRDALPSLIADGWDDVPTLKMMNAKHIEDLELTQIEREALELRAYLHDRSLMEYADKLEALRKPLNKLLEMSPSLLASQYGMKRGHVARFVDRASASGIAAPPMLSSLQRKRTVASTYSINEGREFSPGHVPRTPKRDENPSPPDSLAGTPPHRTVSPDQLSSASSRRSAFSQAFKTYSTIATGEGMYAGKANELSTQKGIVAAAPATPRLYGFLKPFKIVDNVTPLSVLEKIVIQKLTPEYREGLNPWASSDIKVPPPTTAGELWATRPTLIFCIRRPGYPDIRKKLDFHSIKSIFIGYTTSDKAYKLYDPVKLKIFTSRDIIFIKDQFIDLKGKGKAHTIELSKISGVSNISIPDSTDPIEDPSLSTPR